MPGSPSRVRRCPVAASMTTTSFRNQPASSVTRHPVTTAEPSGVSSNVLLVQRPAGIRREVTRLAWPWRRRRYRCPGRAGQASRNEQANRLRPQVVVPEAQPAARLVQDRVHTSVGPGLRRAASCSVSVRAGEDRGSVDESLLARRGRQPGHSAAGRRDPPRLAADGRQQPDSGLVLARLGVLLARLGVRALGREQQRPIGQELRARLALGAAGEPDRLAIPRRIDPPDAGQVLGRLAAHVSARPLPATTRLAPAAAPSLSGWPRTPANHRAASLRRPFSYSSVTSGSK